MQQSSSKVQNLLPWAAAVVSAALLELPFPLAGPMPPWRSIFAWFGLVPLLWALLAPVGEGCKHPRRRAFLLAYLCGVLWYTGNCYWVRDVMASFGGMPPLAPTLLLLGYSMVLGFYFGLFGFLVSLVKQATGSTRLALAFAPFAWAGLELAAARITSVPWDQLGYSQVDNGLVNQLAPWTGVYGISFVLVAVNALIAENCFVGRQSANWYSKRLAWNIYLGFLLVFLIGGVNLRLPTPTPTATAVLIQPNLDVAGNDNWNKPGEWDQHIAEFAHLAGETCKPYIAGIPQTGAPTVQPVCPPNFTHPDLVAWPESPAPFYETEPRFQKAVADVTRAVDAPLVVGGVGWTYDQSARAWSYYNSAIIVAADGQKVGRYDKIHLVPFGEYIPFQQFLTFAHKLTGRVSSFSRGTQRKTFLLTNANGQSHRIGVFICYEAVFADEVRHFAANGAEVLVNISDDGWYGDTSAPWQHFNEARMRAIENRRWLLRDTNNGVTAVIDPYGRVRQSIPRHKVDALPAQFAYRSDVTFYSAHGDVFGWGCVLLGLGMVGLAGGKSLR